MYLTRIALDTHRRETMRALNAVNRLHGAIESAFPGERQRRLWRIDELKGTTWLMLFSETKPDLSRLQAQFGFSDRPCESRSCDELFKRIVIGSHWRFRLVANPTRSVSTGEKGRRGKVVAEGGVPAQREWLMRHAESHGFRVTRESFDVVRSEWKLFRKGIGESHRVSILQVIYEGVLEVTDAERFLETLTQGMGRGRAFGLGMMTVIYHG